MEKQKLFFFVFLLFCKNPLVANPENPTVVHGDVHFEGLNTPSMIIEASDRSIIHWDSFSIGSTEITQFVQPSIDSAVLNRVTGDQMSSLMGTLQANGQIYLINPNGILVGDQGVIDVGSLVASSFDLQDSAFLDSQDFRLEGESLEPITNQGTIQTRNGDLVIVAHRVDNQGTLSAKEGSAWVVAGHEILVGISGKNFLYVRPQLPGDGVMNEGNIEAFKVMLSASSSPFSLGIQNKGSVDALQVEERNGELYLSCKGGNIDNLGTLSGNDVFIRGDDGHIKNEHLIEAKGGSLSLQASTDSSLLADQKAVFNYGTLKGDKIYLNAPKFKNDGSILAQDEISIFTPGIYMETQKGEVSVAGGKIQIMAGNYFTSGNVSARGDTGGTIQIQAENFASTASHFDASGVNIGGSIHIHATSLKEPLHLNPHVVLDVSGKKQGGTIELSSSLPIDTEAVLKYGGRKWGSFNTTLAEDDLSEIIQMSLQKNRLRLMHDDQLAPIDLIDPHSNEPTDFWTLYKASQRAISFYEDLEIQLTAAFISCPPTPLELKDPNPTGTNSSFGNTIQLLSNGNVVVTKTADNFGGSNAGAVYLYDANTAALLTVLTGSVANSTIGSGGIIVLDNGNYVILSPNWNNGTFTNVGAVTFASNTGISGVVSASNSLVGSSHNDQVGSGGVFPLTNGNYVVSSPSWNGVVSSGGAATFCNGVTGTSGLVSTSNSLYGTTANDQVSTNLLTGGLSLPGVYALTNGNYVVTSYEWNNGAALLAGAATWGSGETGVVGPITTSNSLHGTSSNDRVSLDGVTALTNGNYVVNSSNWSGGTSFGLGAATFGDGTIGIVGAVTVSNSLHGSTPGDLVAISDFSIEDTLSSQLGSQALTNGNYVVKSPFFRSTPGVIGAATFGSGTTGITGPITTSNSLCGSNFLDQISSGQARSGFAGIVPLSNGNYVVVSPNWMSRSVGGANPLGAVTFGNGTTGISGIVSSANSLVGVTLNDALGFGAVEALTNGNYVILSTTFHAGGSGFTHDVGGTTFGNGTTGTSGSVTTGNSFVGLPPGVGDNTLNTEAIGVLINGNYVVPGGSSATFGNGTTGIVGSINDSNSLFISGSGVVASQLLAFSNGNYAVLSSSFNGGIGAVTFGNGTTGVVGLITSANSLIGTTSNDQVGGIFNFNSYSNFQNNFNVEIGDQFMFVSPTYTNGSHGSAGAVTFASTIDGTFCDGTFGEVGPSNSFIGANANAGLSQISAGQIDYGLAAVLFTNYSAQTRVFVFGSNPPTPSPASLTPTVPAQTFFYFTNAFAQAFTDWEPVHMNFVGYSIYPPRDTWNGLDFFYDSLLVETEGFD